MKRHYEPKPTVRRYATSSRRISSRNQGRMVSGKRVRGYRRTFNYSVDSNGVLSQSSSYSPSSGYRGGVGGVLVIVVAFLLVATLFQSLAGATPTLSFSGLLEYFSSAPNLSGDWMMTLNDLRIYDDWGIFNFFRDFLNIIMTIVSSLVFLFTGVAQLIVYLGYILGYLFGV